MILTKLLIFWRLVSMVMFPLGIIWLMTGEVTWKTR